MKLTLHQHLKPAVMIAWVIAWNSLLVAGLMLDQNAGTRHAYFTSAFTLGALGTSTLCLAIILLPRMQALTLWPGTPIALVRRELWILVAVTAACGFIVPVAGMFGR
jgi:hypothetical protein